VADTTRELDDTIQWQSAWIPIMRGTKTPKQVGNLLISYRFITAPSTLPPTQL
jgi:hypothetical protein